MRVGTWGGFVFVNMDPDCEPLEEFLGELPSFFDRWPLGPVHPGAHLQGAQVNWKVAQEAFMESFHVITTHPQLLPGFADANSQYDVFGNVSRAVSARGVPSPTCLGAGRAGAAEQPIDQRMDDPPILEVPDGAPPARRWRRTAPLAGFGDGPGVRGLMTTPNWSTAAT